MSTTINNIIWDQIIPPSIRGDTQVQAISDALTPQLQEISEAIKECIILARLDELDEDVVDLLAWQYHVDSYDPDLSVTKKRSLVKNSIEVHRHKGTAWAVKQVVKTIFDSATVEEWFDYEGEAYHFRVVGITSQLTGSTNINKLVAAIDEAKNTRSWLDYIQFERSVSGTEYIGAAVMVDKAITINSDLSTELVFGLKQYIGGAVMVNKTLTITRTIDNNL